MNNLEIIMTYVVGPIVTAVIAFFVGRTKTRAEVKSSELDNVEKGVRIWREIAEDAAAQFSTLLKTRENEIQELKTQLTQISDQHKQVLQKLTQIERDYRKLERTYNELEKNYNDLKNTINK